MFVSRTSPSCLRAITVISGTDDKERTVMLPERAFVRCRDDSITPGSKTTMINTNVLRNTDPEGIARGMISEAGEWSPFWQPQALSVILCHRQGGSGPNCGPTELQSSYQEELKHLQYSLFQRVRDSVLTALGAVGQVFSVRLEHWDGSVWWTRMAIARARHSSQLSAVMPWRMPSSF